MMKFAKLLLESYSRLYEQQQLTASQEMLNIAQGLQPGATQEVQGVNGVGQVGNAEDGSGPYFKGGPFGYNSIKLVGISPENETKLSNWYYGTEGEQQEVTNPLMLDPQLAGVSPKDLDRLTALEEQVPGTIQNLKKIHENALKIPEQFPNLPYEVAKQITPKKTLQRIFGGETRGSLASIIEKELAAGNVKIDRTASISFALDGIPAEELGGAIDTMAKMSEVYGKLADCTASTDDLASIRDKVRKDPSSRSYFFSSNLDDKRFGMSLSVAEYNPINMIAVGYGKYIESCGKEEYAIPEKAMVANANGNSGNFNDMVTKASENIKIASFELLFGDKKKGQEMILDLVSRFGKDVFQVLQMKREVDAGDHALDEMYQQAIDTLDDLGIEVASDIKDAIRGPLKNYMLESMMFIQELKPDYAVRVGGDTTTKGDKSDVDYIMKTRPDMKLPEGALVEVKFQDLSRDAKKAIIDSGDEKQETYFLLKDSLKTYTKEGDVKLGDSYSTETEVSRLLDSKDPHGSFIMDSLGLDDEVRAGATQVLSKIQKASSNVKKLMSGFTTESYPSQTSARKFVSDQIGKMIKNTGVDIDKSRLIREVMDEYKRSGGDKAIGIIDRTIQLAILQKGMTYNSDGSLNKNNKGTMNSLAAFAAIHASIGMDSTGVDPMSEIHIMTTGNTYRENQNKMVLNPLLDLLDPKSRRTVNMGAQTWRISGDGSTTFNADKGRCSANSYINTNHLKKN